MAIVSWIVGGAVGVAIAIGILVAISDSGRSRKRSSNDRTEQVASAPSYVPSTATPPRLPNATQDRSSRMPATPTAKPKAVPSSVRTAPKASIERTSITPSFGNSKNDKSVRPADDEDPVAPVIREPAPSPDQRKEAEDRLREVFRDEFASAADEQSKRKLALDLMRRIGDLSGDKVAEFATLKAAYDLAIEAADPVLARHAVERMAAGFEIDEIAVRSHILIETEQEVRADSWRVDAGCEALELGQLCLENGRFDEARRLSDLAFRQGEASKSAALREAAAALQSALIGRIDVSTVLAEAKASHESNPGDADAAERYGRLLCLEQDDWESGLPLLAESEDPQTRIAAQMDLAAPSVPSEQIETADAWFLLAERGDAYSGFYSRAKRWYEAASEDATGLDRVQARKRLEELASKSPSPEVGELSPATLSLPVAAEIQKDDLWDLTQGASITAKSAISDGSDIRSAFGASLSKSPLAPLVKDGALFDAAPGGAVHFVEWTTDRHVKVGRINIEMRSNVDSRFHGHAETVRILAWDPFEDNYVPILDLPARKEQYEIAGFSTAGVALRPVSEPALLSLTIDIEPVMANRFRAEFVQAGTSDAKFVGPLVMELDAFPPSHEDVKRPLYRLGAGDGKAAGTPRPLVTEGKSGGGPFSGPSGAGGFGGGFQ